MRPMAYVPGVALLAALVAGCSAGSGSGGTGADSKPGSPTVTAAAPGKYRTLPASCRAVPRATLDDLLPGIAELPEDQQENAYEGTPAVTYDTDRKVGCRWKSDAPDRARSLSLDFERVVSYDPSVSDDDRAREVYGKKEEAAGLASASASGQPSAPADTGSPSSSPSGSSSEESGESGDTGGAQDGEDLRPRLLGGIGDAAFLDDRPARAGSATRHRTVSVVFRTSNVVVTIRYAEQPSAVTEVPDSRELQQKAQALARKLSETLSD
ncbi:hypothetical protein GCM10010327_34990 [Streptomyces nitrosporeus]|nr:hypothetical protein GCM10010327_34990 [Streptomyces nitrosporeus]